MILKRYSKTSEFYSSAKADFFASNETLRSKAVDQNLLYSAQPKRSFCKLCRKALPENLDFSSHGVGYIFCANCNHLNGAFEETSNFIEQLYLSDDGKNYADNYLDTAFEKRAKNIYLPKVDFLISTLPRKIRSMFDIGCGGGFFVYSALYRKFKVKGLDINKTMVQFGNTVIEQTFNCKPLEATDESIFFEKIKETDAEIISAIGVIEHLREPHKFFEAFNESNAKYLYYSVPMFSLSVILENVSPNVFPRQLSGGHTHLFTESSILKMHEIMNISSIGEWRFGTDIMDLYRHLMVNLEANHASNKVVDYLKIGFGHQIDALQSLLDKNHFCSEIHVVAEKNTL